MSRRKKLVLGAGIAAILLGSGGYVALQKYEHDKMRLVAEEQSRRARNMFAAQPSMPTVQGGAALAPSYSKEIARADRAKEQGGSSIPTIVLSDQSRPQPIVVPGAGAAPVPPPPQAAIEAMARMMPPAPGVGVPMPVPALPSQDKFSAHESNPVVRVSEKPVSTFSVDVDTSSYSYVRRAISEGRRPSPDAVRVEELVNYFDYDYAPPRQDGPPFSVATAVAPSPFAEGRKLVRIGIKGRVLTGDVRPPLNLVLLVDVSGSMGPPDRLPLLKRGLSLLALTLRPIDRVAIVTYAGSAGTALPPTSGDNKGAILAAIQSLGAGGGTAGAAGIQQAYALAEANYDPKAANRVILATDGDFNVGLTDPRQLEDYIAEKRSTGVFLTVLGFGAGNLNDSLMQRLAQKGNGIAAYIDGISEARRVLVDKANASLHTIAKDMKVQVEFNPAAVSEYRLIGYESRMLAREDFNNDKVDAGDIGEGHTVTALYEITPVGTPGNVDDLRYGERPTPAAGAPADEYAFVKVRWKEPKSDTSELLSVPVDRSVEVASLEKADVSFRFATAVAGFGQILKGGSRAGGMTLADVEALAQGARGKDTDLTRSEFVRIVRDAATVQDGMPMPLALPGAMPPHMPPSLPGLPAPAPIPMPVPLPAPASVPAR